MKIGVLALQGDFVDHIKMLKKCNVKTKEIRLPEDLDDVSGLIIPGGESTTIIKLMKMYKLDKKIIQKNRNGMPIFGTCAGTILLSKEIIGNKQNSLGLLDVAVLRNGYGRQIDSFETILDVNDLGKVKGIFIRAPIIKNVYNGVKVLAECQGKPVLVKQNNILAATFHPEMADEKKVYGLFIDMCKNN